MANEHTDKRYEEELKKLREEILYMGGLVEDQNRTLLVGKLP